MRFHIVSWANKFLKWSLKFVKSVIRKLRSAAQSCFTWIRNRFTISSGSTMLLAICAFLVILLGILSIPSNRIPDTFQLSDLKDHFLTSILLLGKNLGRRVLYGVNCLLSILQGEWDSFRENLPGLTYLTAFLCVMIPLLTATAVIANVIHFFPRFYQLRKETMVFSKVDERSLLLAESMKRREKQTRAKRDTQKTHFSSKKEKQEEAKKESEKLRKLLYIKRRYIFLHTDRDSLKPEQLERLRKLKARVYPYSAADLLTIHQGLRKSRLRFFYLSEDSTDSFNKLKGFIDAVSNEKNKLFLPPKSKKNLSAIRKLEELGIYQQELYILSESDISPLLVDHLRRDMSENGKRKRVFAHTELRLLDRYRIVTYKLLRDKPLRNYALPKNNQVRVLILGFGRVGQSFLRSAASFSAIPNKKVFFTLLDSKMNKHWHEFLAQVPEINKAVDNRIVRKTLNLESDRLTQKLKELTESAGAPFTYIVLSLGDDDRNIRVARTLVRYYRKLYWEKITSSSEPYLPAIFVNLENSVKADYVQSIFSLGEHDEPDLKKLSPIAIGGDRETFAEETLLDRRLWNAAMQLHQKLKKNSSNGTTENISNVFLSEYERRSSIAAVSFAAYHNNNADETAEHKRWMVYSRSEGMQCIDVDTAKKIIGSPIRKHRDVVAGLTPCLTDDMDELSNRFDQIKAAYQKAQAEDSNVEIPHKSFIEQDQTVVKYIASLKEYSKIPLLDFKLSASCETTLALSNQESTEEKKKQRGAIPQNAEKAKVAKYAEFAQSAKFAKEAKKAEYAHYANYAKHVGYKSHPNTAKHTKKRKTKKR